MAWYYVLLGIWDTNHPLRGGLRERQSCVEGEGEGGGGGGGGGGRGRGRGVVFRSIGFRVKAVGRQEFWRLLWLDSGI